MHYILEFSPPMSGFEGDFNTFRLGGKWQRVLKPGDKMLLVDKRTSAVFAVAEVQGADAGKLRDMANTFASFNHNQRELDCAGAPDRLISNMIKRYGPHKCSETSRVSVIHLRRIK
ncbi:hypothetical protein [Methyloversatilis sp.]|uniref:hypothetical protein n=1 Tax=Methyloversatilis sp. TaxID=2569862 RepID=UPI0035B1CFB4